MRITDSLYSQILLDSWAERLVQMPAFDRLHDVSLSSLPPAFWPDVASTSRWEHCLGVYHLARVAQPDDLELHAAALLHDAGQPPFSHLAEHLMVEMLGVDHEERVAELINRMDARRLVPEIEWGSVPPLVLGEGRGQLLSGTLDLDNIDYPLRSFDDLRDAYDAVRLAGGLVVYAGTLALRPEVERDALAWQETRRRLYDRYWSHGNLVPHAMLRKAVEMLAIDGALPLTFFDLTNTAALRFLDAFDPIRPILERLWAVDSYACVWEAATAPDLHIPWREMLELEAEIAGRAGVRPVDIVLELSTSRAARSLPPVLMDGRLSPTPAPQPSQRILHVFVAQTTTQIVDAAEAVLGRCRRSR
ncbi:MAG: HD domain-containing protein [Anaerolineae bacterium]